MGGTILLSALIRNPVSMSEALTIMDLDASANLSCRSPQRCSSETFHHSFIVPEALLDLLPSCLLELYSSAANPNKPAPTTPAPAVIIGAKPDLTAELAADEAPLPPAALLAEAEALDAFELAWLLALLRRDEAELLRLAAADVLFAELAEDSAEDKLELMLDCSLDTDENADEETLEASELIEERTELTAPALAVGIFVDKPIPLEASTGACASAGTAAKARRIEVAAFMFAMYWSDVR